MKYITSRDNPEFKKLLKLVSDARETREQNRTLIDGPHLVATYRQRIGLPETLLVSESGVEQAEIKALIDAHTGTDVLVFKDSLFKRLSGVDSPVGIAAMIGVPEAPSPFTSGSCVLLDAIQDAGNVGSILRSTAASGIRDIFLGQGCANAWSPRVLRAAQGAHFRMHIHQPVDLAKMLASYEGQSVATVVSGGESLFQVPPHGNIAWIFGSEGQGVSPALLSRATRKVMIPMAVETESLNVAAAAAICLFAAAKHIQ